MKFALSSALLIGAGLLQVAASPIRVIVSPGTSVAPSQDPPLGHEPAVVPEIDAVATIANHDDNEGGNGAVKFHRRPCNFKTKAIQLTNLLREALGLPPIEAIPEAVADAEQLVKILPWVGTPASFVEVNGPKEKEKDNGDRGTYLPHPRPERYRHKHHHHKHRHGHSYGQRIMARLHAAALMLGPWEGRAVAFVLGCGIGVLLRMLWVLSVVGYRSVRPANTNEQRSDYYVEEQHLVDPDSENEKVPFLSSSPAPSKDSELNL